VDEGVDNVVPTTTVSGQNPPRFTTTAIATIAPTPPPMIQYGVEAFDRGRSA
jgi:hypothetical protein